MLFLKPALTLNKMHRTLYFDSKSYKPDPGLIQPKEGESFLGDYEKSLVTVGKFDTVR